METLKSRNGKEWGGLVTREEHRERNSLNGLRLGCYEAFFMPETIRQRAERVRREELRY